MAGMNRQTGKTLSGLAQLQQSLQDILTTPIGSRVMRHAYGSRLFEYLDQPVTPALTLRLSAATAEAIATWEPRFLLSQVKGVAQTAGGITLSLSGRVSAQLTPPESRHGETVFEVEVTR